MKIYKIAQNSSHEEDLDQSNQELQSILNNLEQKYPGLDLWASESRGRVKLNKIVVPLDARHQGIGSEVIKIVQDFAQKRGKPLVVAPAAERGYKKKLDDFYRSHGFVPNKGRNTDYSISDPFGATMYWKPS